MSDFTQDFFTSRRNDADGNTRIGQLDRLWYDSITNTIRISDGVTPGGIVVSGGGGGGSGYSGYSGFSGAGITPWIRVTSNYTSVAGDRIIADTTGGSFTIDLPPTPTLGAYIIVVDGGNFAANPLTIGRNGSTIEGNPSDYIANVNGAGYEFIYDGTTWQLVISASTGGTGASGYSGYSGVGLSGFSGIGSSGYSGISGYSAIGSSGYSGISGYSGVVGYSGYSGANGVSNLLLAVEDSSTNPLYPVMVAAAGSNQTPKVSTSKIYFNASTGTIYATSKSFVIPHPTKDGKKLVYGSLEGPENGVYIRGRLRGTVIDLPEYWAELVDIDTTTVNLTSYGTHQKLYIKNIASDKIVIGIEDQIETEIDCYFTVFAERKDIAKLLVES